LPLRTTVTLILLSIILPALSRFLLIRLKIPENKKNKILIETCGVFFAIGAAVVFLAQSWISVIAGQFLVSIGSVFLVPARSLMAGLVEQQHTGAVFTLSSVSKFSADVQQTQILN
jgi:drug/metabolite transporter (DMT)-like permease